MVQFVPLPALATQPEAGGQVAMPAPTGPTKPFFAARCPISRTVDLNEMAAGEALSGTVFRRDFFVCGPFEGAVQGLWLGASVAAVQSNFQIGLVDEQGAVIAALQSLAELPARAKLLLDVAAETADRSLYLRVETDAQDVLLFVTLDVTLDEVM
jgi:hypothetical protein